MESELEIQKPKNNWLEELTKCVEHFLLAKGCSNENLMLTSLTGDAGFRRYFRTNTEPSLIAVYAPPETEKNRLFCQIGECFRQGGVHTPEVLFADFDKGYMVLEDLGDAQLLESLNSSTVNELYHQSLLTLKSIQMLEKDNTLFDSYSKVVLEAETALFHDWYLIQLLGIELKEQEIRLVQKVSDYLAESASSQTQVVVHRDFHSRNLMLLDQNNLGVIDFQDAVIGPVSYDLVSLLKDCYVRWDKSQVETWVFDYFDMLQPTGILSGVSRDKFLKDFHLMGLQRHLKVLGIFARLSLRDGKHGYLGDLPRVVEYVLEVTNLYPELAEFDAFLRCRVIPEAQRCGWYKK